MSEINAPFRLDEALGANIVNRVDQSLPLKARLPEQTQMPDPVAAMQKAYSMANQIGQVQDDQEIRRDRQTVQQYMQEGGNIGTPEGIEKAVEDLKGKVSVRTYQDLVKNKQESATWAEKLSERYLSMPEKVVKSQAQQQELVARGMSRSLAAYDDAMNDESIPEVDRQRIATERFNASKQAIIEGLKSEIDPVTKRPVLDQKILNEAAQVTPGIAKSIVELSDFHTKARLAAARAKQAESHAEAISAGGNEALQLEKAYAVLDDPESTDAEKLRATARITAINSRKGAAQSIPDDPESQHRMAKMIAEYKVAPLSSVAMLRPAGAKIMGMVAEMNPEYDANRYAEIKKADLAFGAGGKEGGMVRSMNVGIAHLATLKGLGDALENKDYKRVNQMFNWWKTETGQPAPTNFDGAKQIVAAEIMKAIVAGGGGVEERRELAHTLSNANGPKALQGVIDSYTALLGGQLEGLKLQYKNSTGKSDEDFDKMLTGKAKKAIGAAIAKEEGGEKPSVEMQPSSKEQMRRDVNAGKKIIQDEFDGDIDSARKEIVTLDKAIAEAKGDAKGMLKTRRNLIMAGIQGSMEKNPPKSEEWTPEKEARYQELKRKLDGTK